MIAPVPMQQETKEAVALAITTFNEVLDDIADRPDLSLSLTVAAARDALKVQLEAAPVILVLDRDEAEELRDCIGSLVLDMGTVVLDDDDRKHVDTLHNILARLEEKMREVM